MTVREVEPDPRVVLLRALLIGAAGSATLVVCLLLDLPGLDVALWTVLVPLLVAGGLALLPHARRQVAATRRTRAEVVVPDTAPTRTAPDPAVQAREQARTRARERLLAAKELGAPVDELLALARELHEADLDLARALTSAGGHVPQALRDELAVREQGRVEA